jgi:acetyl-CoA/propionyl-CoA carboxylase biotin carboxyl carrier protein
VRVDSGVGPGAAVTPMYDPMVAKLIVWDADREQATRRMLRALGEYEIEGLKTLLPFHRALLATEQWAKGETCRDLLGDRSWLRKLAFPPPPKPGAPAEPQAGEDYTVEVSGRRFDVRVIARPVDGPGASASQPGPPSAAAPRPTRRDSRPAADAPAGDELRSPMQGTVLKVAVGQGDVVERGALVVVVEAMKMESEVVAHKAGRIASLPVAVGASVAPGDTLAVITTADAGGAGGGQMAAEGGAPRAEGPDHVS